MYVTVWKFIVRPEHAAEFERHYGPEGTWVMLFRRSPSYVRTELYRSGDGAYLTLDYWENAEAYAAFREEFAGEYARIDEAMQTLTEREEAIASASRIQSDR